MTPNVFTICNLEPRDSEKKLPCKYKMEARKMHFNTEQVLLLVTSTEVFFAAIKSTAKLYHLSLQACA